MGYFILKNLINKDLEQELKNIGFDEGYRYVASDKFRYKNIKIFDLTPEQANIVKQTALTVGADCATNKEVIRGNIEKSDVILGGSISELKQISSKLKRQPFKLENLGSEIEDFLKRNNTKSKTKLVGILNITPDSFSDGGKYIEPVEAQKHLIQMIEDGADVIDIGAESTKPYSKAVPPETQIERLRSILNFIKDENIKTPISIDTRSSVVAEFVLDNGADIINDVSGFDYDANLAKIVAKYDASVIIQHSQGTPENMQDAPTYQNVVEEVYLSLLNKIKYAKTLGINNIIADVGIGFGKTKKDNFELLNRIEEFFSLDVPVMVGLSRKSLLSIKENDNNLKDSLSLALSYPLIQSGVDYLRVHNVKLHEELLNSLNV